MYALLQIHCRSIYGIWCMLHWKRNDTLQQGAFVIECWVASVETLTPDDYEVSSVARECVDADRGNECHVDADELGATCYSSCTTHYCNDETPRPTWQDLLRRRISRPPSESDDKDAPSRDSSDTTNNDDEEPRLTNIGNKLLAYQVIVTTKLQGNLHK